MHEAEKTIKYCGRHCTKGNPVEEMNLMARIILWYMNYTKNRAAAAKKRKEMRLGMDQPPPKMRGGGFLDGKTLIPYVCHPLASKEMMPKSQSFIYLKAQITTIQRVTCRHYHFLYNTITRASYQGLHFHCRHQNK